MGLAHRPPPSTDTVSAIEESGGQIKASAYVGISDGYEKKGILKNKKKGILKNKKKVTWLNLSQTAESSTSVPPWASANI
jgi:hypothetical protein